MSELASPLQERRLELVREHMQSENEHRFDDTLETFDRPRYEIMATGDVHDGHDAVAEYYRTSRRRSRTSATSRCPSTRHRTR